MEFLPLSQKEEYIAKCIVNAAYIVHKSLGPGLLENVYETCFSHELFKARLETKRQVPISIIYDGIQFNESFRLDILVEDLVICELKAVENLHPVFKSQLLTYLKLSGKRLGFLINFNVPTIKSGISRIIL